MELQNFHLLKKKEKEWDPGVVIKIVVGSGIYFFQ